MEQELNQIKSNVINKVSLITALMLTPAWIFSMLRFIEIGWQIIFLLHTFIYYSTVFIYFFRNKLSTSFKIISIAVLYALVAFSALKAFGFSSAHYYSIVALAILSLIQKRRYTITFLVAFALLYIIIAIGYSTNKLTAIVDLENFSHMPLQWANLIITVFSLSVIFIYAFGSFHNQLLQIIDRKTAAEKKLEEQNESLEKTVLNRTHELQSVNKELMDSNEQLIKKQDIIKNQNKQLADTLEKLKDAQQRMVQSEKMASIGVFTSGIAHEINNPLNFIIGSYYGLQASIEKENMSKDKTTMWLEHMKTGVERISDIINSLNAFNSKKTTLPENYNLNSIINNCLQIMEYRIGNAVEIRKIPDNKIPEIVGDIGNLHQAFTNILSNALDAIDENGIITIETMLRDNNVVAKITDTGTGIPKQVLHRITEPFFTTKPPGKGTGLGLSITYKIIKEHQGELTINSKENEGTTVAVSLPISR